MSRNNLSIQVVPSFIKPLMMAEKNETISHMFKQTCSYYNSDYIETVTKRIKPVYDLHNVVTDYAKSEPFGTTPTYPWVFVSPREAEALTEFFQFMKEAPWKKL
jgi:hypothetical protein